MDKDFSPLDSRRTIGAIPFDPVGVQGGVVGPVSSEDGKSRLRLTPAERDEAVWIRIPDLIRMNCGLSHDDMVGPERIRPCL